MAEIIRASHPAFHPERVSLVVTTRGRPQQFLEMAVSACGLIARPEETDLWVFLDEDDVTGRDLIATVNETPMAPFVNWLIAPRQAALGQAQNIVCAAALETSGLVLGYPDDFRLASPGWDDILRHAYRECPGRLALHYIQDPTAQPEQITIMAASKEWIDTIGYFIPAHFPYWFGDNWLDEVSQLAGMKRRLDIVQVADGGKGKTRRMWNLPFWSRYYRLCRLERLRDALKLTEAAGDAVRSADLRARLEAERSVPLPAHENSLRNVITELRLSSETAPPNRSYLEAEARACRQLSEWASRDPAAFHGFEIDGFDVDAALAASDLATGVSQVEQQRICKALLSGRAWGAIAEETGVGVGRLLEWRNAAALTLQLVQG
ncbi:hypothetical protein KL86APRO_11438 [uncultured Alphaproteobacteria bacterium]|uniref:Glycosyltransferase 2-like domain-containing protein n=1 Tax=uncultured Alphaproteobacteria bacterium TaxID=91750 RepID=A0A212JPU7_9PROT|nr:hypothetical protein KL86APRO_11438 [uncultured Alphaproteobacteria bacterium]